MEQQLDPLFKSIVSTVKIHEENIMKKTNELNSIIKDKDCQIKVLQELNDKLKGEMKEFLKVSFASRWKRKSEELEEKITHYENKLNELSHINAELNHHIDMKSKNDDKEIQTDEISHSEEISQTVKDKQDTKDIENTEIPSKDNEYFSLDNFSKKLENIQIEIKTNKGAKYVLKNKKLYTIEGKDMGLITNIYEFKED